MNLKFIKIKFQIQNIFHFQIFNFSNYLLSFCFNKRIRIGIFLFIGMILSSCAENTYVEGVGDSSTASSSPTPTDGSSSTDSQNQNGSNSSSNSNSNSNGSNSSNTTSKTGPDQFTFESKTNVNLGVTITSSTFTISGLSSLMLSSCYNCTGMIINNIQQNITSAVLREGDLVAIQLTSATLASTSATAILYVGTTSGTFIATTTNNTPAAFAFTNLTNQITSATITSSTVTLSGSFTNVTATCGAGCTAISKNGSSFSAGPIPGFNSGDTIAIQLYSPSTSTTTGTASVIVGSTTSAPWSVTTTTDLCADTTPAIGALCADGTVYVGTSYDGGVPNKMFATRCDYGQTWDEGNSTCTGTRTTTKWSDGNSVTGITSTVTGRNNTTSLYNLNGVTADGIFHAATFCEQLNMNGHSDWYLPAKSELNEIWVNYNAAIKDAFNLAGALGYFDLSGTYYGSSTESTNPTYLVWSQNFLDGSQYGSGKVSGGLLLRCVRRN